MADDRLKTREDDDPVKPSVVIDEVYFMRRQVVEKMRETRHPYMAWKSHAFLYRGGLTMNVERYLTEEAIIKKGVDALVRELGPVEAMRFLSVPRERRQESVKRHREWQKKLDKDRFLGEVFG
jgi:hypothetical protein